MSHFGLQGSTESFSQVLDRACGTVVVVVQKGNFVDLQGQDSQRFPDFGSFVVIIVVVVVVVIVVVIIIVVVVVAFLLLFDGKEFHVHSDRAVGAKNSTQRSHDLAVDILE